MRYLLLALLLALPAGADHLSLPGNRSLDPDDYEVRASITDGLVTVRVWQVYSVETDRPLAAEFQYQVPAGVDLVGFRLAAGDQRLTGAPIDEPAALERLRERGIDTSHVLEPRDRNRLHATVPIAPPGCRVEVGIEYHSVATIHDDIGRWVYPRTIAAGRPFRLEVQIDSSIPLRWVRAGRRAIVEHAGDRRANVRIEGSNHAVIYRLAVDGPAAAVRCRQPVPESDGFFSLLVVPGARGWTDVEIDWGESSVRDASPAPDREWCGPYLLAGRYGAPGRFEAVLVARRDEETIRVPIVHDLPAAADGPAALETTWARHRLDSATGDEEAVRLALDHGIVTRRTPFIICREEEGRPMVGSLRVVQESGYHRRVSVEFGGRMGGMGRSFARGGGGGATLNPVELGLRWLDAHRNPEGGFSGNFFDGVCGGSPCEARGTLSEADASGLALLAFVGAGHRPGRGRYWTTIGETLERLVDLESASPIATLALIEAYGIERDPDLRMPATRALERLLAARDGEGSWGSFRTTIWGLCALKSAGSAALPVPAGALEKTAAWIDARDLDEDRAAAAAKILARSWTGRDPEPATIERLLESNDADDLEACHLGTIAAFRIGGETSKIWDSSIRPTLRKRMSATGHRRGSWDPTGPSAAIDGRLGATARGLLVLEVYYRYDRAFK